MRKRLSDSSIHSSSMRSAYDMVHDVMQLLCTSLGADEVACEALQGTCGKQVTKVLCELPWDSFRSLGHTRKSFFTLELLHYMLLPAGFKCRCLQLLASACRTMTRVSSRQADVFGEEAIVEEPLQAMSWTKAIALVDPRDIESCEELLEAYFMQACSLCPFLLAQGLTGRPAAWGQPPSKSWCGGCLPPAFAQCTRKLMKCRGLPSGWQGQRLQPPGDLRELLNPNSAAPSAWVGPRLPSQWEAVGQMPCRTTSQHRMLGYVGGSGGQEGPCKACGVLRICVWESKLSETCSFTWPFPWCWRQAPAAWRLMPACMTQNVYRLESQWYSDQCQKGKVMVMACTVMGRTLHAECRSRMPS